MGALSLVATFVAIAALTSEASEECTAEPPPRLGVEFALIQQRLDLRDSLITKFMEFKHRYGRTYETDSQEYQERFTNFKARVVAVEAHNAKTESSWTAAVNHLADYSPAELAALRGYRHSGKKDRSSSLSFVSVASNEADVSTLPTSFSWKGTLGAMEHAGDQGACGSCWAVSSAVALRAHAELYQRDRTFSAQQILECTPNPEECGGTGGCQGATAELAMEYVKNMGLATADNYTYRAIDRACPSHMQPPKQQRTSSIGAAFPDLSETEGGASFGMLGYRTLPENKLHALLEAVYERGPVVVSIAADDAWSMYSSGIMQACSKDAVINHAVILVGYGETDEHTYYLIQNSWGSGWGEDGFVKLLRHSNEEEEKYCGWDTKPKEGTACKNSDPKVWICGSCGILYDSVVPVFALSEHGFLSRHSRDSEGVFTKLDASARESSLISSVVSENRPH